VEPRTAGFETDSERPLTGKGKRKMRQIAEAMLAMELSFDLILSSTYVRARQTAIVVTKAFKAQKALHFSELLVPNGSHDNLIGFLNHLEPRPSNVLLVGHEPYMSEFISWLVSGGPHFSVVMKKGGLCKLSTESLKHGRCAALEWLITPKQMGLMD
jgi:phosphohistidine phosphatase